MKRVALAAILVWFGSAGAYAQEMPRYAAGQAFVFDNGRVERVESIQGSRVTWAARSGQTYVRDVNPVVPILEWSYRGQSGARKILGRSDGLWPLASGRSARFKSVNETRDREQRLRRSVHLWECSVRSRQRVTVPAGIFDAYPIVCDRFSPNSMRVLERITWDYAPEVGHYIRREARDMRNGQRETYSLSASLSPRAANDVRIEFLAREALLAGRASRVN